MDFNNIISLPFLLRWLMSAAWMYFVISWVAKREIRNWIELALWTAVSKLIGIALILFVGMFPRNPLLNFMTFWATIALVVVFWFYILINRYNINDGKLIWRILLFYILGNIVINYITDIIFRDGAL